MNVEQYEMIEILKGKSEAIAALCRRHCVKRLNLFGSAAIGPYDADRSDLDFLVEFLPEYAPRAFDHYFALLEGLEALFQCEVDLVCASAMKNPYFIRAVNDSRRLIYAA